MKLIKSSFEILGQKPGLEGIYEQIELAGRTCYKSQRKEGTIAKDFVDRMIKSGHNSMLEHGTVYLKIRKGTYAYSHYVVVCEPDDDFMSSSRELSYRPYTKVNIQDDYIYVTTNYRHIVENGWLDDLKYLCEPTEFHEKRVTVRFTTDRGVSHEFVRHRVFSFAQESTRYCNYSKEKFGSELTFIQPVWTYHQEDGDYGTLDSPKRKNIGNSDGTFYEFIKSLQYCEQYYFRLLSESWKPQQARAVLPNALKTELVMTGFVSDWNHFFRLRTSIIAETGKPHPDASALADPLYKEFINRNYLKEM